MLAEIARFFSIYLVLLFFIFITGYLVSRFFKRVQLQAPFTRMFFILLCGLVSVITAFASYHARLQTACVFLPLVVLSTFYKRALLLRTSQQSGATVGSEAPTITESSRSYFFLSLIGLILFSFLYFACIIFKSGDFHFAAVHYDAASYAELSAKLADTGLENKWFLFFTDTSAIKGVEPYHYLECWLNAIPYAFFNTNPLQSLYLLTCPILVLITLTGICAVIEHFRRVKGIHVLLAVLLLFTGALPQIKNSGYQFGMMAAEIPLEAPGEKFAVYYPFLLFGLLLVLKGYPQETLVWLLSLCIVSATLVPALLLFYILSLPFLLKHKQFFLPRLPLFFALYFSFYGLFSAGDHSSSNSSTLLGLTDLQADHYDLCWFKLAVSNVFVGFTRSFGYFAANYAYVFPLIAVVIFSKKIPSLRALLYALLTCFSGLVAASFFYKMGDSHQLFTNTLPLLHCVTLTFILLLMFGASENRKAWLAGWLLTSVLSVNAIYSALSQYRDISTKSSVADSYMEQAKQLTEGAQKDERIGFIYNQQDQDQLSRFPEENYLYHVSYLGLNPVPFRLSLTEVNYSNRTAREQKAAALADKHELFKVFFLGTRSPVNPDSLRVAFIRQQNLRYLLTGPTTALPAFLNTRNSTVIRDPKTGIRFIRLDNLQLLQEVSRCKSF